MPRGRVRWFNRHFGFGFIRNRFGRDIFVHYTVIDPDKEGDKFLLEGEEVVYSSTGKEHRHKATKVERSVTQNNS
jgi:cold shock CspA family protein